MRNAILFLVIALASAVTGLAENINVHVSNVQKAGETAYTDKELSAICRLQLKFQMSGVTGVEIESVDGLPIAGTASIQTSQWEKDGFSGYGMIIGDVQGQSSIMQCYSPTEAGFDVGQTYCVFLLPQNTYWGYRLRIFRNGQKADVYCVHQIFESGSVIQPENLIEAELEFEALDAPLVEEERPELDQKTKDLLKAYRKNPSQENYDNLYEQMTVRYDRTTARKKAKLRELEREAGYDKIIEMLEIVDEMVQNRDERIRQRFLSLIDFRTDDDPNDQWLIVKGTDPTQEIYIGYAPITNAEYKIFKSDYVYPEGEANFPVVNVSVGEANEYCNWLIEKDSNNHTYRLPTDEEWLLAAGHMPKDVNMNAGNVENGLTDINAYSSSTGGNGGIDYWGNCWEWTNSTDSIGRYIIKGGAWDSPRTDCRSEKSDVVRNGAKGFYNVGFRVVRSIYTGYNDTDIADVDDSEIIRVGDVEFEAKEIRHGDVCLTYRAAQISPVAGERPSLILCFHGATNKGNDNVLQMQQSCIDSLTNYLVSNCINSIFIIPQCPTNLRWGAQTNPTIKELIEEYIIEANADPDRIYIFGNSMGGRGATSLSAAYPGLFAAVMDVAGSPQGQNASKVAKSPFYAVVGDSDDVTSAEVVSQFVEEVNRYGGVTKLDIIEGWTHEETLEKAYTKDRLNWMFSKTKGENSGIDSVAGDSTSKNNTLIYNLQGQRLPHVQRGFNIVNGEKILIR